MVLLERRVQQVMPGRKDHKVPKDYKGQPDHKERKEYRVYRAMTERLALQGRKGQLALQDRKE